MRTASRMTLTTTGGFLRALMICKSLALIWLRPSSALRRYGSAVCNSFLIASRSFVTTVRTATASAAASSKVFFLRSATDCWVVMSLRIVADSACAFARKRSDSSMSSNMSLMSSPTWSNFCSPPLNFLIASWSSDSWFENTCAYVSRKRRYVTGVTCTRLPYWLK